MGALPDADGAGSASDEDNRVTIYLRLDGPHIVEARFRALACNACIAAASVATTLLQGATLDQTSSLDAEWLIAALDGLPADKHHCAELAALAARRAVEAAASTGAGRQRSRAR